MLWFSGMIIYTNEGKIIFTVNGIEHHECLTIMLVFKEPIGIIKII